MRCTGSEFALSVFCVPHATHAQVHLQAPRDPRSICPEQRYARSCEDVTDPALVIAPTLDMAARSRFSPNMHSVSCNGPRYVFLTALCWRGRFYVITGGETVVTIAGKGEIRRQHRGDYFGELALIQKSRCGSPASHTHSPRS